MHEELRRRLNMGNVCYHLVQRLFFFLVSSATKEGRYQNNFFFFRMRVLNLVAQIKGITQA